MARTVPSGFSSSLLLSVSLGRGLGEQEAVVGGDDDVVAVQVVDDVADQRRQFVDGLPHRLEGFALGLAVVADGIDRVVVDVDDPLVLDELPALVLLHRHQLVGLAGHPAHGLQDVVPLLGDASTCRPPARRRSPCRPASCAAAGSPCPGRCTTAARQAARSGGLEAVLAVEFGGEFLGRFVAEGIADDDEGSPVLAFSSQGRTLRS